ncbi:hypothetical protein ABIA25_001806 [Sinorhizobium fredii]
MALVDSPFDEGFLRVEIEHVILVDPRRADQQRSLQHRFGARLVLDDLTNIGLRDHLARGDRNVLADGKFAGIRLPEPEFAAPGGDVLGKHLHALDEIGAARCHGLPVELRVGGDEVARGERAGNLADVEGGLVPGMIVEPLGLLDHLLRPVGCDEIGLADEVEKRVLHPVLVRKALVAALEALRFGRGVAGHPVQRPRPDVEKAPHQMRLCFQRPARIGKPVFGDFGEGLDHVGDRFGEGVFFLAGLPRRQPSGRRLSHLFSRAGQVDGQVLGVLDDVGLDRFGIEAREAALARGVLGLV